MIMPWRTQESNNIIIKYKLWTRIAYASTWYTKIIRFLDLSLLLPTDKTLTRQHLNLISVFVKKENLQLS